MTRILIVEDEESLSDPLSYLLEREGFEVRIADDGLKAVTEFERHGADLVLLDLMLPGQPGTEVIRQIPPQQPSSGHHAHRQGLGDRQGGRAGAGRR